MAVYGQAIRKTAKQNSFADQSEDDIVEVKQNQPTPSSCFGSIVYVIIDYYTCSLSARDG